MHIYIACTLAKREFVYTPALSAQVSTGHNALSPIVYYGEHHTQTPVHMKLFESNNKMFSMYNCLSFNSFLNMRERERERELSVLCEGRESCGYQQ